MDSALKEAEKREITINHAGTLAEAAMKLSGVFKAADDAASLYLENIQRMEREAEELHAEKIKAAQKEAMKFCFWQIAKVLFQFNLRTCINVIYIFRLSPQGWLLKREYR